MIDEQVYFWSTEDMQVWLRKQERKRIVRRQTIAALVRMCRQLIDQVEIEHNALLRCEENMDREVSRAQNLINRLQNGKGEE